MMIGEEGQKENELEAIAQQKSCNVNIPVEIDVRADAAPNAHMSDAFEEFLSNVSFQQGTFDSHLTNFDDALRNFEDVIYDDAAAAAAKAHILEALDEQHHSTTVDCNKKFMGKRRNTAPAKLVSAVQQTTSNLSTQADTNPAPEHQAAIRSVDVPAEGFEKHTIEEFMSAVSLPQFTLRSNITNLDDALQNFEALQNVEDVMYHHDAAAVPHARILEALGLQHHIASVDLNEKTQGHLGTSPFSSKKLQPDEMGSLEETPSSCRSYSIGHADSLENVQLQREVARLKAEIEFEKAMRRQERNDGMLRCSKVHVRHQKKDMTDQEVKSRTEGELLLQRDLRIENGRIKLSGEGCVELAEDRIRIDFIPHLSNECSESVSIRPAMAADEEDDISWRLDHMRKKHRIDWSEMIDNAFHGSEETLKKFQNRSYKHWFKDCLAGICPLFATCSCFDRPGLIWYEPTVENRDFIAHVARVQGSQAV